MSQEREWAAPGCIRTRIDEDTYMAPVHGWAYVAVDHISYFLIVDQEST